MAKKPQKQVLKSLELTTLLVALDHLEEYGPGMAVPDPYEKPAECVYLTYVGEAQAEALANRVPHHNVTFHVPGGAGKNRVVRRVYSKAAITHVLKFCFPRSRAFVPFVRSLKTVAPEYWRVLDADGKPTPRPKKDKGKGKSEK